MTAKQRGIVLCWNAWEIIEPDISTEQLMARVCEDCNCDASTVAEALEQEATEKQNEPN